MSKRYFYVYVITNKYKTALYVGFTNNLKRRLNEHESSLIPGFSARYKCKHLVYFEKYDDVVMAISREKTIKKWGKEKKRVLVGKQNPEWLFLNERIYRIDDEYL